MERLSRIAVIVIAIIATTAALRETSDIVGPVVIAVVTGIVLSPLMGVLEDAGVRRATAALTSLGLCLILLGAVAILSQPLVAQMIEQAPKIWADMQDVVRALRGLASGLSDIGREVSSAVVPDAIAAPAEPVAEEEAIEMPTVTDALMIAPGLAAQILTFTGTLFFFLLTRDDIYEWIAVSFAEASRRGVMARRLREAEKSVSRYFLTIAMINAGLGVATGIVLQFLGLPDAPLWGVLAAVVNFVVYLGPAVLVVALVFAGVAAFDGVMAALPALSFLLLNFLEGQFITPALVGRRMELNPLLVFLSLIFGLWLWGPIGGIVAIPIIVWVVVLKDGLARA